jgi:hypothetical protein
MKIATVAPGGVYATMAMNQTKKSVSVFCSPTMMQMKPRPTRIALGATDDQFQCSSTYSCFATSGVNLEKRWCSLGTSARWASGPRLRTNWFSMLQQARRQSTAGGARGEHEARLSGRKSTYGTPRNDTRSARSQSAQLIVSGKGSEGTSEMHAPPLAAV